MIVERRVVVLSRGGRLGTLAVDALGGSRSLACLQSPVDLADWARPPVDVVLMDFPRRARGIVYRQLRQRYRGPVLALLEAGDDAGGLPPGRGPLAVLQRPFSGEELADVLGALLAPPDEDDAPAAAPAAVPTVSAVPAAPDVVPAAAAVPDVVPPQPEPVVTAPAPAQRLPASATPTDAVSRRARPSRWDAPARRGLRRWQVAVGATALVLLGLSIGAPSGCGARCAGVAGAAESDALGTVGALESPGAAAIPAPGSAAPPTGSPARPGAPTTTSAVGSLLAGVGGGSGVPSLMIAPAGGGAAGAGALGGTVIGPTPSPPGIPTSTTGPTATTQPPTTQPPPTSPPPTAPPTTSPPPTSPPTAPPTTEPPTTEPPPTEPPPPPPPPPQTDPPPPTTGVI